ncbi:hypothetical protein ACTXT7_003040 [Hymenolepis weldensis]
MELMVIAVERAFLLKSCVPMGTEPNISEFVGGQLKRFAISTLPPPTFCYPVNRVEFIGKPQI